MDEFDLEKLQSDLALDIKEAETFYNTELSNQRKNAYHSYYGTLYDREKDNSNKSRFVSRDVFTETEGLKSILMDVFTANQNAVTFSAKPGLNNALEALKATAYCNNIFYNKNRGEQLLQNWIHDGLLLKLGIIKIYWKSDSQTRTQTFQNIPAEQIQMLQQNPQVQDLKIYEDNQGMLTGEFSSIQENGTIKIEVVPPENFLIDADATNAEDWCFIAEMKYLYDDELMEMGFNPDDVRDIGNSFSKQYMNLEKQARDSFDGTNTFETFHTKKQTICLYECYKKIYVQGKRIIVKVFYAGSKILYWEPVKKIPFRFWTAFPIPHKFFGLSIYDVLSNIELAKTSTTRQIMDNLSLINNPRCEVDLANALNPQEIIDNNIGQVVFKKTPQPTVTPIITAPFDPNSFAFLQMLDKSKEDITGNTPLVQGNEPMAIEKGAAASLINALSSSANRRPALMAKFLAQELAELFRDIVEMGTQSEPSQQITLDSPMGEVQLDPSQMSVADIDMKIKVALTPQQQHEEASNLIQFHQIFMGSPALAVNYGPNQQFLLLQRAMELLGVKGREMYLLSPVNPEYLQAVQQQQQMQQQQQQREDQVLLGQMSIEKERNMLESQRVNNETFETKAKMIHDSRKLKMDERTANSDILVKSKKLNIDQQKVDQEGQLKQAELLQNLQEIKLKTKMGSGI